MTTSPQHKKNNTPRTNVKKSHRQLLLVALLPCTHTCVCVCVCASRGGGGASAACECASVSVSLSLYVCALRRLVAEPARVASSACHPVSPRPVSASPLAPSLALAHSVVKSRAHSARQVRHVLSHPLYRSFLAPFLESSAFSEVQTPTPKHSPHFYADLHRTPRDLCARIEEVAKE